MQAIKNFRSVAWAVCLGTALSFAGCNCNGKSANTDSAKTDSSIKKTDSMKTDNTKVDSTKVDSAKTNPTDSVATPPAHVPQKDTTVHPRPLVRKT